MKPLIPLVQLETQKLLKVQGPQPTWVDNNLQNLISQFLLLSLAPTLKPLKENSGDFKINSFEKWASIVSFFLLKKKKKSPECYWLEKKEDIFSSNKGEKKGLVNKWFLNLHEMPVRCLKCCHIFLLSVRIIRASPFFIQHTVLEIWLCTIAVHSGHRQKQTWAIR